jgi:SH3-like domain-containing protein
MLLATALAVTAAHAREGGEGSGLAVPRFVSLKSDKVNVR